MIVAQNLTKRFDNFTAVDDLSLEVAEGEVLALLGHNGAGKTTTIRCLAAILEPTSGTVRVGGYDTVQHSRQVRQRIGLLTEFPGLYHRMAAEEYLHFFADMHGLPSAVAVRRIEELLRHFDLWRVRRQRMGQYSKGMRQKMALVRALLHAPPILFLDEPTSALDPHSAKQVRDFILGLRGQGRTIVLCTHNLDEAEKLADRIAIIARGRILALGSPETLKRELLGPPLMEVRTREPLNGASVSLAGWLAIVSQEQTRLCYRTDQPEEDNPRLLRALHDMGHEVVTLSEIPRSLEALYLQISETAGVDHDHGERG